jgi:hypothetical protein
MKIISTFLLAVLLVCLNGCMTGTVVNHARGTWQGPFIEGTKSVDQNGKTIQAQKPNPAYYALVPLTVPFDIVTSPFQLVLWLWAKHGTFQT